ncbi:MAG: triose-phosphate isomerase [Syntrophaceticus sp.]
MGNKRTPLVAGNWKMHKTPAEAGNFVKLLRERVTELSGVEVIVCPPFPALAAVANKLAGSQIGWGAQNMHWETEGPFTGEVSGPMLQAMGCRYVILGHSERRSHFGETDDFIRRKLASAIACGLRPIFCLGESLATREVGNAVEYCLKQLRTGLEGLELGQPHALVVAYEPVWAIGTGKTARPEDAVEVISALRQGIAEMHGKEFASGVRFLYGGSVTPESISSFMKEDEIDGVLVGSASLNIDKFTAIIQSTAELRGNSV